MSLFDLLKKHKETCLIQGNGFSANCILYPPNSTDEYSLTGFAAFTGLTINESGFGAFGDTFELTINIDELKKYTDLFPNENWKTDVYFPSMEKWGRFKIEAAPIDRTIGTILLKCSALTSTGAGKIVDRSSTGGI